MGIKVALGKDGSCGIAILTEPETIEERVDALQQRIDALDKAYNKATVKHGDECKKLGLSNINMVPVCINKDKIPIGTRLLGLSNGWVHNLAVETDGYYIGMNKYSSLASAAKAVVGIDVDALSYWKLYNGKTVKEFLES